MKAGKWPDGQKVGRRWSCSAWLKPQYADGIWTRDKTLEGRPLGHPIGKAVAGDVVEFAISEVRTCTCAAERPAPPPPAHKSVDRMCVQEKPVGNTMLARVRDVSTFDSYDEMLGPQGVDRVQQFLPGFTGTIAEAAEMYRASYTAVKYKSYGLEDGAIALHVEPLTDH